MQNVLPFSTQRKTKSHLIMKVDASLLYDSTDGKRSCTKEQGTSLSSFNSLPSKCFPTTDRIESQAWMNPAEIPRGTRECWASPNATLQFKALKGCRTPTVLQLSFPHKEAYYLAAYSSQHVFTMTRGLYLLCFLPVQSHTCLMVHNEHLCSS